MADERILRSFFLPDGRLKQMPVKKAKQEAVLAHLAESFEPGRHYPEPAVNEVLRQIYPDFCTLRRALVDNGFLQRSNGVYWRCETGTAAPAQTSDLPEGS